MSSFEVDVIYELLLKRYKEYGFLRPEAALNSDIEQLMEKGKTREEAMRDLYSSGAPRVKRVRQKAETEEEIAVQGQIAELREKIDTLTVLFSKGEITEETYRRGVRKIEEDIRGIQREHNIQEEHTQTINLRPLRSKTRNEIEETRSSLVEGGPSGFWWLVPFFFGIIGGIVAYVGVKDEDEDMAGNLLWFGIIWTVVDAVLYFMALNYLLYGFFW